MPIANSDEAKDALDGLPVVTKGEDLQTWLNRSVPALVESGESEDKAIEIATEAWNQVNASDQFARSDEPDPEEPAKAQQEETEDTPEQEDALDEAQLAEEMPGDEPAMDWNSETWGEGVDVLLGAQEDDEEETDEEQPAGNAKAEDAADSFGNDEVAADMETPSDTEGDIGEWYARRLLDFSEALGNHLLINGLVDNDQLSHMLAVVQEMTGGLNQAVAERMAPPAARAFHFSVSLPDSRKFSKNGSSRRDAGFVPSDASDPEWRQAERGFTYQPVDDSSPIVGFAIFTYQGRQMVAPVGRVSPADITQYMIGNEDIWDEPNHFLSVRYDTESDRVYLGVSIVVETAEEANALAIQNKQEAYWDIATGETIAASAQGGGEGEVQKSAAMAVWAATKALSGPGFPHVTRFPRGTSPLEEKLAIKSIGRDRVGNYLCVWGDPAHRDLAGEYFTPRTQEMTAIFDAIGAIPAIYHHALDGRIKSAVIGLVDVMQKDDVGMWIEAQVRDHEAYRQYIQPLINERVLGWSSGALPGGRHVNKSTGEILRWPVVEASMTPTPMEWRMSAQWPVRNIKAVYQRAGIPFTAVSDALAQSRQTDRSAMEAELELIRILELS